MIVIQRNVTWSEILPGIESGISPGNRICLCNYSGTEPLHTLWPKRWSHKHVNRIVTFNLPVDWKLLWSPFSIDFPIPNTLLPSATKCTCLKHPPPYRMLFRITLVMGYKTGGIGIPVKSTCQSCSGLWDFYVVQSLLSCRDCLLFALLFMAYSF